MLVFGLNDVSQDSRPDVGGKFAALALLARVRGSRIPPAICVGAEAYRRFVGATGLRDRIELELNRKAFEDMRWEEVWDAALRVRNLFLRAEITPELVPPIQEAVRKAFGDGPVAVRSSAPWEDSSAASFAGLHESYVNVAGPDAILEHIRLVWASLWSDRALLYRRELGLDVRASAMAVIVQNMVAGNSSGVAFSQSPTEPKESVIEAVHGLNQGLVDGAVEPDRWLLNRRTGEILSHSAPARDHAMRPGAQGAELAPLPPSLRRRPPISAVCVKRVFSLAVGAEDLFVAPQDVEWTLANRTLYTLQSRPITTLQTDTGDDQRPWYLSLTRTFENLRELRTRIESSLIPEMQRQAAELAAQDLAALSNRQLTEELARRRAIVEHWQEIYRSDFIPFAHGVRLFGQVYNDRIHPEDPYEFVRLLRGTNLESVARNRALQDLAADLTADPDLADRLRRGVIRAEDKPVLRKLEHFDEVHADIACLIPDPSRRRAALIQLALATARAEMPRKRSEVAPAELTRSFLAAFSRDRRGFAKQLLELARASFRLRDNDNVYLGRIEAQELAARTEAERRLRSRHGSDGLRETVVAARKAMTPPAPTGSAASTLKVSARQIVGQPAGPGFARGIARVVRHPADLFGFQQGEVLVCDAIDPKMTFVVPLAAAVVERRGGMLIHGAIIAREYGLPCVTGVPSATTRIHTGDTVAVDGYLGIVTLG